MFPQLRSSAHRIKYLIFNTLSAEIPLLTCDIWAQAMQDPDLDQSVNDTAVEAHTGKKKDTKYSSFLSLLTLSSLFSSSSTHMCTHVSIKVQVILWKTTINNWQYPPINRRLGSKPWFYPRDSIWLDEEVSPWWGLGKGQQASFRESPKQSRTSSSSFLIVCLIDWLIVDSSRTRPGENRNRYIPISKGTCMLLLLIY